MKRVVKKQTAAICHITTTVSVKTREALQDHVERKNWSMSRLARYILTKWCKDNRHKIIRIGNMPRELEREFSDDDD